MFFPFWFFHQGSNFCRACKSSVCISAIYLLDLFLFSDKTFSSAVFFFFFTFTTIMVFTCLCVLQKKHLVEVIIQTTAVPVAAQVAADLAAGAVLLAVAARPVAGNSTIKMPARRLAFLNQIKSDLCTGL